LLKKCLLVMLLFLHLFPTGAIAKPLVLQKNAVDTTRVPSDTLLVQTADLIVYGRYDTPTQIIPTSRKVSGGKLVNYVQLYQVRHAFKGRPGHIIRIVSSGVEPLAPAGHPSHMKYPGPVAEGAYVCFLKKIEGRNLYRLIGGWQGLYPVVEGKLISLQDAGFPSLQALPLEQLKQFVQEKR